MGVGGSWKSPRVMFYVHPLVIILRKRVNGILGVSDRIGEGDMKA